MVFQEQSLIVTLNVAQNIFFGLKRTSRKAGVISWAKMNRAAAEVLAAVDITNIPPSKKVSDLNFATRQMVEIAKGYERHQAVRQRTLSDPAGRAHFRAQRG